jgi:general secretion pathway protein D
MKQKITTMQLKKTAVPFALSALLTTTVVLTSVSFVGMAAAQTNPVAVPSTPSATPSVPNSANATPPPGVAVYRNGNGVTLNFTNAEIAEVARTMGVMTGRSIVVDPRVKGTMNLSSDKPLTTTAAYNQFLTALRLQGFTVVESAGISKVVPEADAKLQGGTVTTSQARVGGNQILTQIFRLNYETANNLVPILRPLISPNNTINVNPGNNSLVITDYADNLQRMARIIAALDVSNASDLEIITLQHALASELGPLLVRLSEGGGAAAAGGQADGTFKTTIIPEPRSNSIIVRAANPARLAMIKALVVKLDQPTSAQASGNIHVVYLKNADAIRVAATLRAALAANTSGAASAGGGGAAVAATPAPTAASAAGGAGASAATAPTSQNSLPSTGGNIQADPATNSLIITASEPQYRQIKAVIEMLDTRRAQVFVESLIVEVTSDKTSDFGVQWQGAIGNSGAAGTNFSVGNILRTTLANVALGLNIGATGTVNGQNVLGFLANFLQTSGQGNVLSTPNLLTIDNEEAKIVVGQNVPFITGQFTNTGGGGSGTVNPFQTIERKDVGLTLRIKPQISENGTIKMQIFQEDSSVDPASRSSASGLTTNKRSIESSVLVEDGGIVAIGGLLQDDFNNGEEKVPVLGDIPFLGNLFKRETRSRKKRNLMIFLRPVVIRDADSTQNLSLDRYDIMRVLQKDSQPVPSRVLQINEAPVLPPSPATRSPSQTPALLPLGQPEKGNQ